MPLEIPFYLPSSCPKGCIFQLISAVAQALGKSVPYLFRVPAKLRQSFCQLQERSRLKLALDIIKCNLTSLGEINPIIQVSPKRSFRLSFDDIKFNETPSLLRRILFFYAVNIFNYDMTYILRLKIYRDTFHSLVHACYRKNLTLYCINFKNFQHEITFFSESQPRLYSYNFVTISLNIFMKKLNFFKKESVLKNGYKYSRYAIISYVVELL